MDLDISLLRRAKVENLERLAKSLGVDLPRHGAGALSRYAYTNELVLKVNRELRKDTLRYRRRLFWS